MQLKQLWSSREHTLESFYNIDYSGSDDLEFAMHWSWVNKVPSAAI